MLSDGLKYQDSRMATCEEMKQDLAPFALHDAAAKSKGGPVLLCDGDTVYTDPSDSHSLIVGDTGSMKTLRFVLPLIYSCAAADESMVIVDPKGELARKSESFLSAKGYKTVIINMRDPQRSPDTWNPMGVIERAHKSGEEGQQKAVLQLNDMLNDIFFRRVDTKDPYWNESAGQLALGICLLLLALGEKLNMKNLLKWRYEKLADGTLDAGGHSGSAAVGGLVHIAVEVVIGEHGAAHGGHADHLAVQVHLVDDLGHQTVDDTVVAAGAIMELLVSEQLGLFEQYSHLIYPPSCSGSWQRSRR